ncbi:tRNA (adenosine(37)-N6)-threonylcarbamoyltransferase complex ATPase subunit type 1 TsaE [Streptomyces albus]|uniref:tRNA (adenosine(37)-N6)-threonylcarbamoyltransferase complex ATPase subunit type 1 TsaE n=1 Tax=Streptomyces albus TaxID=1888 RepID=UPI0015713911
MEAPHHQHPATPRQTSPEQAPGPRASGRHAPGRSPSERSGGARNEVTVTVPTAAGMRELGVRLAGVLRAGDLVLLTGELGAGKTTLTRGLGEGLGVRGAVTSPTFVIARVHPSLTDGPPLVHVDAYRLGGGLEEMEDLDLDVSLPESVVVVEWGEGKVEELTEDRLHVVISRALGEDGGDGDGGGGGDGDDERTVRLAGVGERWAAEDLAALV